MFQYQLYHLVKLGDGGDVDINLNDAVHVDGLTKNVGIGTTTIPSQQLDVDGNGITRCFIR